VGLLVVQHGGQWTGLTSRQIEARFPGELDRWRRGEVIEPPGSEPMGTFTGRVVAALCELAASRPGTPGLVVAHQGVLRALERHLGVAPASAAELRGVWLRAPRARLAGSPTGERAGTRLDGSGWHWYP
jgi:broad specificity phosphatase PhoE